MTSRMLSRRTLPTACSSNAQQLRKDPSTYEHTSLPALSLACSLKPASSSHSVARGVSKRTLLTGSLLAALTIPARPSEAYTAPRENQCVLQTTDDDAEACRLKILEADAGKQQDYGKVSNRTFSTAGGVPVADMSDTYTKETLQLYESIVKYGTLDPYDKSRPPLIKSLKADCANWVSQYARGGSARKQSARKFYVAVDAVSGHLSSNGLAPFPARKFQVVRSNMDEALGYLSDGK